MKTRSSWLVAGLLVLAAAIAGFQVPALAQDDPAVRKIIELGTKDNQVMTWADYASNRFGGRITGSNAYNDATAWAVWQFKQWGIDAELDEVGEVPVGFNRGPWFGKMLKPTVKALRFGTPSFTAGTKGIQHGGVVILKADPFSIPGRGAQATPENVEKKRAAVASGIAEVNANKAAFKDKWVLIAGNSTGFGRDGRRGTPEYADSQLIPPLTRALIDAGALGTIQSAVPTTKTMGKTQAGQSEPPLSMLDGYVASWDKLPILPDIKLLDTQYAEIKSAVEKNEPVDLEFDIRNWFKMGPVKYHNVVATIRGTTYPDEYVVMGGHFDCFDSATGGVDDGNGFSAGMEALRLIKASGARPKRSIVMILFAAEENGLVGSQAWLKKRPQIQDKIVLMMNRDSSPTAITGATVPSAWFPDFQRIGTPLANLNARWPFTVKANNYPGVKPIAPGGSDHSSFQMLGVPTLAFTTETDYVYPYAWHTLNDLYSELAAYTEHQKHSALVTAVLAYGVANLDKPLTRDGVYLPDGLYADIVFGAGEAQKRIITTLDFVNAPVQAANFVRIAEGKAPQAGGGRPAAGPGGQRPPEPKPIGNVVQVKGGTVSALVVSDAQKSVAIAKLPKTINTAVKHDGAGVFGVSGPNAFYVTLQKNAGLDRKYTALGRVVAGLDVVKDIKATDPIRSITIRRAGTAALGFKTDDESFKKLVDDAGKR